MSTLNDGVVLDVVPARPISHRLARAAALVVAAYVVFVAIGTAIGLLLVHVVDHGRVGHADEGFEEMLARHRSGTANHSTAFSSGVANTLTIIAAALLVGIVWRLIAKEWKGLALLAVGLTLEVTSFVTMAALVDRPRPDVVRLDASPPTSSFPSGHTAAAVVLYGAIAVLVFGRTRRIGARVAAAVVAVVVPLAVAAGRLYRGMHHPSDVLVGVLLGIGALTTAVIVLRRWHADDHPEPVESRLRA